MVILLLKISYGKWIHVLCFKNVNMNDHVRMGKKWYVHYEIRCFGDVLFTYFQWDSPQKPKSCFSKMDSSRCSAVCWGLYYIRQLVSSVYTIYIHSHTLYIYMKYLINYTYTWLNCIQIYTRTCVYYIHITHLMSQSRIAVRGFAAPHFGDPPAEGLSPAPPASWGSCHSAVEASTPIRLDKGIHHGVIRWRDFIIIHGLPRVQHILIYFEHVLPCEPWTIAPSHYNGSLMGIYGL